MPLLNSSQLRALRTPKSLPVGTVLRWEETLCVHRQTYRVRQFTVESVEGMNLVDRAGDYHYWTDIKHKDHVTAELPEPKV